MQVAIPPEIEVFAREQVAAGTFPSEEAAFADALRRHLARVEELRALIDPAIAEAERGDTTDGRAFLRDLADKARARRG